MIGDMASVDEAGGWGKHFGMVYGGAVGAAIGAHTANRECGDPVLGILSSVGVAALVTSTLPVVAAAMVLAGAATGVELATSECG